MLFIVALVFSNIIVNAQSFEGIINMSISNAEKGDNAEVVWKMKGEKSRLEYVGSSGDKSYNYVLLMSTSEAKAKILTNANGKKVVYTVGVPSSQNDNVRYIEHSFTSSSKMIGGFHAEQLTLKSADRRTICWVSKDAPITTEMLPASLKANGVFNYMGMHKIKGIPLEMETVDASGKTIFSQKITSIKAANISDNEFVVGSDYLDPSEILKAEPTKTQ